MSKGAPVLDLRALIGAPSSLIFSKLIEKEVRDAGSHLDVDEAFAARSAFMI